MRKHRIVGSGLIALNLALAWAMAGCSGEEKAVLIKFTDCPAAVQKTIITHAEGVKFYELSRESRRDGRVDYSAKGKKAGGGKMGIKIAADGRLLHFKCETDKR